MLRELRIRNFVLIEALSLEFVPGFNVLTGETGAGKTIIIDALGLLLGERARGDLIRPGADEASVEAVFERFDTRGRKHLQQFLIERGLEHDPEGLFIKRIIPREGRGRCYVNSSPAQLKVLEELGDLLVDIHGQHEHQSLLRSEVHMDLLDAYAGLESQAESVRFKFAQVREIDREIERLEEAQRERRRQEDHLKFQVEEIEQAEITADEEEPLERERRMLQHAEQLAQHAQAIEKLLVEGAEEQPAITDGLADVQRRLQEMAQADDRLASLERDFSSARIQLEEIGREIVAYGGNIEADPQRLEAIEQRLHLLQQLKRKYGATLEEVLVYLEQTRERLAELETAEESLGELTTRRDEVTRQFVQEAISLSQERQRAAVRLSRAVTRELRALGMAHGQFRVQLEAWGEGGTLFQLEGKNYRAGARGIDRVEFLVTTNPGRELGPLKQVASGGELSRIALAIKTVLAQVDRVGTLVFDEIDSGIGGDMADIVGVKFRRIAAERQVICITHLPQIAGKAHGHFRVSKTVEGQQTQSSVERIEGEQIEAEIARMLGDESSEDSRTYARRLLEDGQNR